MNERVVLKKDQVRICVVGVGALGSMVIMCICFEQ